MVGSGAGLVLQLFSCFTGDESAIELWLLLSSSKDRTSRVSWFFYIVKFSNVHQNLRLLLLCFALCELV